MLEGVSAKREKKVEVSDQPKRLILLYQQILQFFLKREQRKRDQKQPFLLLYKPT